MWELLLKLKQIEPRMAEGAEQSMVTVADWRGRKKRKRRMLRKKG